ncbi:PD40 domain-containing protein [Clostridium sp. PL3]|uniref:PD40 domain-containing protein n=1 Tax=Clostridium thailandense TaxID=2794346 RepID=A0A949TVP0_9CLOT|nr:hypothetical protein [Clostridium thailandense]MBV7276192.1 PD40 domain-containing protein [Clostridium thailandense]
MIKSGKRSEKIEGILALTIAVLLIITAELTTGVLVKAKGNKVTTDFVVIAKENGLWLINLSKTDKEMLVDKGGLFKTPSISPDGQNVAYIKDKSLYVASIDLNQGKKEIIKVSEQVLSYGWATSSDLAYSTEKGGLNGFNATSKKFSYYIKNEEHYEQISGDGKGTIYASVFSYYTKEGYQYYKDRGIISYNIKLGKEKVVIPSEPISTDASDTKNLGFLPEVAGISKDGAYVYIWCKVHSASINSDGVGFGVYEVKNNKFTAFNKEKIFALAYSDNLAINPLDGRFPDLNNGGARNMNINKTLGVVDILSGTFTPILPKDMIASTEALGFTAKGMVTMTPDFSPDGKKVIFSAANASENMEKWHKEPHNIYTVDLQNKKVEKITEDNNFNFSPTYISKGEGIIFARVMEGNTISLWKLQGNKKESVATGIKLDERSWYYGHFDLTNSLDIYVS